MVLVMHSTKQRRWCNDVEHSHLVSRRSGSCSPGFRAKHHYGSIGRAVFLAIRCRSKGNTSERSNAYHKYWTTKRPTAGKTSTRNTLDEWYENVSNNNIRQQNKVTTTQAQAEQQNWEKPAALHGTRELLELAPKRADSGGRHDWGRFSYSTWKHLQIAI